MGLKISNYEVKSMGVTLPEAYAIIKNIEIRGDKGSAMFAVQTTRERALTMAPIKSVRVEFEVDRTTNAYVTAYQTAIAEGGKFEGWEGDIVTE